MKINKTSVVLTNDEFNSLIQLASAVLPVMHKPYDDIDSYFNTEDVFSISVDDYNMVKSIYNRYYGNDK